MKKIICLFICLFMGSANASLMRTVTQEIGPGTNGSWSFGTVFTVGANDMNVTSLGAYDNLGDGFVSGSIQVAIIDELLGTTIVAANVQSTDTLLGLYRYSSVNATLLAGNQYRMIAVSDQDLYIQGNGNWNYTSDVVFNSWGYCATTAVTQCDSHQEGDYGMGNFQYGGSSSVPEPGLLALLGLGLGLAGIGFARKK